MPIGREARSAVGFTRVQKLVIQANGGRLTPDQVRTILGQSADDLGKPGNDDYEPDRASSTVVESGDRDRGGSLIYPYVS